MGPVSEYDITEPISNIHNTEEWKKMSPEDRRRTAVEFYYSILGICREKRIAHCSRSDAKFIAKVLCMGDPQCFFYCGYDKMVENAARLPGQHTLELAIKVGSDWDDRVKSASDMEELSRRGRQSTGIGWSRFLDALSLSSSKYKPF